MMRFSILALFAFPFAVLAEPVAMPEKAEEFISIYCSDCHGDRKPKAGVVLDGVKPDFSSHASTELWINVMDQINAGVMPPEDEFQPTVEEISDFTGWLAKEVLAAEARRHSADGRVVLRRLNRTEYAHTIKDLLGVDFNTSIEFPLDETRHGFDRIGASLTISPSHMESYADAAAKILDRAIVSGPRPKLESRRIEGELVSHPDERDENGKPVERPRSPVHLVGREGSGYADVERVDGKGAMIRSLGISFTQLPVKADGTYKVRIHGYGVPFEGKTPQVGLRYGRPGENTHSYLNLDMPGTEKAPATLELELRMRGGARGTSLAVFNHLRTGPGTGGEWRKRKDFWQKKHRTRNPLEDLYAPQVFVDYVEVEGPIVETWPPLHHQEIFFEGPEAKEDEAYAREIVERFMARAYRRPVTAEDVDPVFQLVSAELAAGEDFQEAVKLGLQAILCSPDFLYLVEDSPGKHLTSHQLATRLSYFLWSSMPDATLRGLADSGELLQPAVLRKQVDRMLTDGKSERLVKNFARQWLQLGRVGQFPPDPGLFPEWNENIEAGAIGETLAFFNEIFRKDLDVINFLHSDWSMLNETMADYYGIEGVKGGAFRQVRLPSDARRGGVLTHASVLSLTGDGTRTRPVHRGVWVMEAILAQTPQPPPPDVPDIEPNVPGAARLTVRERLEAHASQASCAACHKKIDPLGMAFENYNAIGLWRTVDDDRPRSKKEKAEELIPPAPKIDASGKLPDGRSYQDAEGFKKILLEDREAFLKALSKKMFIYALGREAEFSDREAISKLAAGLEETPTLKHLVANLVLSEAFRTK